MQQQQSSNSFACLDALSDSALLRLCDLINDRLVPFSASTVWRKCKTGDFPEPVKVSAQITAWRLGDIREWIKNPAHYKKNKNRGAL
jgi:prophage regulatory protein